MYYCIYASEAQNRAAGQLANVFGGGGDVDDGKDKPSTSVPLLLVRETSLCR